MANSGNEGNTSAPVTYWTDRPIYREVRPGVYAPPVDAYQNPDYPFASNYKGPGGGQGAGAVGNTSSSGNYRRMGTKVEWNPPPHKLTKAPKIAWSGDIGQGQGSSYNQPVYQPGGSDPMVNRMTFGRLGSIYTDDWVGGGTSDSRFARGVRYGCVFHYNPTSISYGVGTNDELPTYNSGSQAGQALLTPGTVQMSLELYFNRIYDLAAPAAAHYERALRKKPEDEAYMIKLRGTEYDIEYLYRSANGDPQQVRHADYKTADFGFIMRSPVRLRLGAFTYIVLFKSLSVDHLLFTEDMVPTFSKVSVVLDRQITLGGADSVNPDDPAAATVAATNNYRFATSEE